MPDELPFPTKKYLIVNADDYGLSEGVSRGILVSHRLGMLTSTTAMMNMPDVETALLNARRTCPHLGLGVHLVLTAGKPLLPSANLRTLTGAKEKFNKVGELIAHHNSIDYGEVRAEWQAQIDRFINIMGQPPDHLDSHHHCACFTAGLFEVMLELADGLGCPVRNPLGTGLKEVPGELPQDEVRNVLVNAPELLKKYKSVYPKNFIPSFYDGGVTSAALIETLKNLPLGVSELMSHPGYVDENLLACSSYTMQREREVAALTDPAIVFSLAEWGIELINFKGLK